jgi:hypothetical protein
LDGGGEGKADDILLSPALPVVCIHLPTTLGGLLFCLFGKLVFLAQTI